MAWSKTDASIPTHMRLLIALLRLNIGDGAMSEILTDIHSRDIWEDCRKTSASQGVQALAWDGILMLEPKYRPPRDIMISWGAATALYEDKYKLHCKATESLSNLFAGHGIGMIQFKGAGLSTLYPTPCHREGGDVDIITYSLDTDKMSHLQANQLADRLMMKDGSHLDNDSSPKHSCFDYMGVHFENHKMFLNPYPSLVEAERYLKTVLSPVTASLWDGEYKFDTANLEFNNVFIPLHLLQHYRAGHTLHHFCDWAVLLKRGCGHLSDEIGYRGIRKGYSALNEIVIHLFGDIAPEGVRLDLDNDSEMAEDLFLSALFPEYDYKIPAEDMGVFKLLIYKTRRLLYFASVRDRIFGISISRTVMSSLLAHIRRPSTILAK